MKSLNGTIYDPIQTFHYDAITIVIALVYRSLSGNVTLINH